MTVLSGIERYREWTDRGIEFEAAEDVRRAPLVFEERLYDSIGHGAEAFEG